MSFKKMSDLWKKAKALIADDNGKTSLWKASLLTAGSLAAIIAAVLLLRAVLPPVLAIALLVWVFMPTKSPVPVPPQKQFCPWVGYLPDLILDELHPILCGLALPINVGARNNMRIYATTRNGVPMFRIPVTISLASTNFSGGVPKIDHNQVAKSIKSQTNATLLYRLERWQVSGCAPSADMQYPLFYVDHVDVVQNSNAFEIYVLPVIDSQAGNYATKSGAHPIQVPPPSDPRWQNYMF